MKKTKRLTITELEQIRQRAEAATGGEWRVSKASDNFVLTTASRNAIAETASEPDTDFIANARQDVPTLLTEVETLILEKAAARRMLDELIGEMANAAEAGYTLAPETVRSDLEKIRKELIDHGE